LKTASKNTSMTESFDSKDFIYLGFSDTKILGMSQNTHFQC